MLQVKNVKWTQRNQQEEHEEAFWNFTLVKTRKGDLTLILSFYTETSINFTEILISPIQSQWHNKKPRL